MIIPGQPINIENRPVKKQDFGTTVYKNEEEDVPTVLNLADTVPARHFVLYRCRTKETYDITKEVTRIGRNPRATDFCVSGNDGVGRVHAIIRVIDQKVYIEDNCSKNGTFVNGVRIQPGMGPYFLENGAKIRLSDEELEFHVYN